MVPQKESSTLKSNLSSAHAVTRASPSKKWMMLLLLLAPINAMYIFDRVALTVASPIIQAKLGLTLIDVTVLVSSVLWTYSLLQIPVGWCVTKFGERRMMLIALLLWSVSTILTPLAQTFSGLILLRLLLGIGQSPDWSASVATVRSWFGPTERSRGTSVILAAMYLGGAIASPITAMIVARAGWRMPFYIFGGIGLVQTLLWFWCYKPPASVESASDDGASMESSPDVRPVPLMMALIRSPQFWCLGASYACILTIQSFIAFLLPNFLIHQRHVAFQTMGWLVGIPSIFLWSSVVAAGVIADRVLRKTGSVWLARTPLGCLGCLIAGCATEGTAWIHDIVPMTACLCVSYFCLGFAQVSLWSAVQDLTKHYTGVLAGWAQAWGNLAYAGGPILMAVVVQNTGSWKLGLGLPLAAGFLGALLIWWIKPQAPISTVRPVTEEPAPGTGARIALSASAV